MNTSHPGQGHLMVPFEELTFSDEERTFWPTVIVTGHRCLIPGCDHFEPIEEASR